MGAKILSTYKEYIEKQNYRMYCIVNTKRPDTDSASKIISMVEQINIKSRIRINALINNTNLANETSAQDILEGHEILQIVSQRLDIPIAFVCANEEIINQLDEIKGIHIIPHKVKVIKPWE